MLLYVNTLVASNTSKKELPADAVSLFGGAPGLFTPKEEKSVTFDDICTI